MTTKELQDAKKLKILEQVFMASSSVNNEDLNTFLSYSDVLPPEDLLNLLLKVKNQIEREEMKRILSYLPFAQQFLFEIMLKKRGENDLELEEFASIYNETRYDLLEEFSNTFNEDPDEEKTNFTKYLLDLPEAKLNHVVSLLQESPNEVNQTFVRIINSILEAKKVK